MKHIIITILILINISCKNENKNEPQNLKAETEYVKVQNKKEEKKPFVIAINTNAFFLNDFNLSKPFNEKDMIESLGIPDKIDKDLDNIEETGYPDYDIKYRKNTIWASYGYVSNVYLEGIDMKINGIMLNDKKDKVEKKFNIRTNGRKHIRLINQLDESVFIKFDKNNIITELYYSKLIL